MSTIVATPAFSPGDFIDREKEQGIFDGLLGFGDDARLLTICDGPARGKSHLLKLLKHKCQVAGTPVSLVPIEELKEDKTPYGFIRSIVESLEDSFELHFQKFDEVEDERLEFLRTRTAGPIIRSEVNIDKAHLAEGGQVVGILVGGDLIVNPSRIDELVDVRLRKRAVRAFFEDIHTLGAEPIVLLVDTYEQCSQELADWFLLFLRKCVFDLESRPAKLVTVLAGQDVPTTTFQEMIQEQFDQIVRSVEQLSIWKLNHVKEFTARIVEVGDLDIEYLHAKLERGLAIGQALEIIDVWRRMQQGPSQQ
jgi:hypothetical protein